MDDRLLEKLSRVRALADDAKNEHEGRTAMLMFQRLLDKHGLNVSDVEVYEGSAQQGEQIDTQAAFGAQRVETWIALLHVTIAKHFRCVPAIERKYRGAGKNRYSTLQFIGHTTDAQIAAEAFKTALTVADRMFARYELERLQTEALMPVFSSLLLPKETPREMRNGYYVGFVSGLEAAYKQQEAETTFDIIITTPADVLEAVKGYKSRNISANGGGQRGSESEAAGYKDGFNVGKGDRLHVDRDTGSYADMPTLNYGA